MAQKLKCLQGPDSSINDWSSDELFKDIQVQPKNKYSFG